MKKLLELKDITLLLLKKRKRCDIIIGVPHHAPAGISELPCEEHKQADENAGFIGQYIAKKLKVTSIIACNYILDSNKDLCTDYGKMITKINPKFLIEIHGHDGKKSEFDVEISCGSKEQSEKSEQFARILKKKCNNKDSLKDITISGNFDNICYQATKSETIVNGNWTSFHIELSPRLRQPEKEGNEKEPSEVAYLFAECIVKAIDEIIK